MPPPPVQRTLTGMPQDVDPGSDPRSGPSALVVPIGLPTALAGISRRWDEAAQAGAGPHVTILYPFLPCSGIAPADRDELAGIARSVAPFDVRFAVVRRFPGLVWIEPEPARPFAELTTAITERWPDYPPYGGIHASVIPHLTVVQSDGDSVPFGEVEDLTARAVPFTTRAERLELWCQDQVGRWRVRWRVAFRVRP